MYDGQAQELGTRSITQRRFDANNQVFLQNERYKLVIEQLIQKKVVSEPNNKRYRLRGSTETLILPHELELSLRSSCKSSDVHERRLRLSSWKTKLSQSEEEEVEDNLKKKDMIIENLQSIRSSFNISFQNNIDAKRKSLYSQKTCPICCEDYAKDDDIAWSKNEECIHAFHTNCIIPWLMDHEECPMSRSSYIFIEHA